MSTGVTLNGTDLRTLGYNIEVLDGLDAWPGLNISGTERAFEHGAIYDHELAVYRPRSLVLALTILPQDPVTGLVVSSPLQHVEENLQTIMGLLHRRTGISTLVKTLPSGATREALVIPQDAFPISKQRHGKTARLGIRFEVPYPFWHGDANTPANQSGSFSITNEGNAPVADAVITFVTAGTLTHTPHGDAVSSSEAGVVVDCRNKTFLNGSTRKDGVANATKPRIIQLEPGVNQCTATGTVSFSFRHGWLS